MREVKGGFANSVFKTVFTPLRAFLKSDFFATQLCIRSGVVSWMPFNPSSSGVPSCFCPLIRFLLVLPYAGLKRFLGLGPGQVNSVLDWKSFLGLGPGQVNNVLDF